MKSDNKTADLVQSESNGQQNETNAGTLLPVLDILNNMIIVANYISQVNAIQLPKVITSNSGNSQLITDFTNWQYNVWELSLQSLIDSNVLAQPKQINKLHGLGITDQSVYQSILGAEQTTPNTISVGDDLASMIGQGEGFLTQLEAIADNIKHYDQEQIDQLEPIIDGLSKQFDDKEQEITDKAIDNSTTVIVTSINVAAQVAEEKDPVEPLAKGVAQVGTDVIKELEIGAEIQGLLQQLESLWTSMDADTVDLARMKMLIKQMKKVVTSSSEAITALGAMSNDWQKVCNITTESSSKWINGGLKQVAEWADRMSRVQFYGAVTQNIQS